MIIASAFMKVCTQNIPKSRSSNETSNETIVTRLSDDFLYIDDMLGNRQCEKVS